MTLRGINYDVGTHSAVGRLTRPDFDPEMVQKEIQIIHDELHCDAIRISGANTDRLMAASRMALEAGLQVWISPAFRDISQEEAASKLVECAKGAEQLREKYGNIIFVTGFELSLFLQGFVRGRTIQERLKRMFHPMGLIGEAIGLKRKFHSKLNAFFEKHIPGIRRYFKGEIAYASGTWEKINWALFDIAGVDHYRASYNKAIYSKQLDRYLQLNKPVAIMEFGCCSYKGAADKGALGWAITKVKDGQMLIEEKFERDEQGQADYITSSLDELIRHRLQVVFVFTFVNPLYVHDEDPHFDLDMASYGIVKPLRDGKKYKGLPWQPKKAFYALSEYYEKMQPVAQSVID